jgi:hypothetical protein
LSLGDLVRKGTIEANLIVRALQTIFEPAHATEQKIERIITAA